MGRKCIFSYMPVHLISAINFKCTDEVTVISFLKPELVSIFLVILRLVLITVEDRYFNPAYSRTSFYLFILIKKNTDKSSLKLHILLHLSQDLHSRTIFAYLLL